MKKIYYRKGYKYQVTRTFHTETGIIPKCFIEMAWWSLDTKGVLSIYAGYAHDGPSGPTFDTQNSIRAATVHDALYGMMRNRALSKNRRKEVDLLFYRMLREDGMSWFRAKKWYFSVRQFGGRFIDPSSKKKERCAPSF